MADEAWEILQKYDKIRLGKGKKVLEFSPTKEAKDEILKNCLGRSGTLRAPSVAFGAVLAVGFNDEIYNGLL